jgi:superfamily II DNA/RNA helicase
LNFDKFDAQVDNGRAPTQLRSWDNLLSKAAGAEAVDASGDDVGPNLRQAIEWYGWEEPTKFQAVAIPCVGQACRNVATSRSYTLLQARAGIGKTSALALSLLACVQREVSALQYVCLGVDACEDMEKYINTLGCLSPIGVAYFPQAENVSLEDDVCKAMEAQVLVGHPSRIFEMLAVARDRLNLAGVEALMLDDASKLIEQQLVQMVCDANKLLSTFVRRPLRYIVVSDFVENEAKNALRALKSSLMSKRNMFDISAQVQRIRKHVKHYIVHSEPEEWVSQMQSLRNLIFIPRAVIFCDDESRFRKLKTQFEKAFTESQRDRGKEMSFGVSDGSMTGGVLDPSSQSLEQREKVMSMFVNGQYDFLLTRSEPNIFQSSLPRVFWVIHFGVDGKNVRDLYGARLMCLDTSLRHKGGPHQDGVSLLFLAQKDEGAVPNLQKSLKIKFEPVPLVDI